MALISSFGEVNLDALDKSIADTAVDIFVYDTRKDSDGGKWRKRTKKTSWYNETLNTATRGSRREFPAVAVIVATSNAVTIYDGDDPDLPMWMVFNTNRVSYAGSYMLWGTHNVIIKNGLMVTGSARGVGFGNVLTQVNFINEWSSLRTTAGIWYGLKNIANRNTQNQTNADSSGTNPNDSNKGIVDNSIDDLAITVLSNAPVDPTTGIPVPTVAIATENGISVIKDDGNIVDAVGTTFDVVKSISFDKNNRIICSSGTAGTDQAFFSTFAIPSADLSNVFPGGDNGYYRDGYSSTDLPWYASTGSAGNHSINEVSSYGDYISFGTEDDGSTLNPGLKIISENISNPSEGMLCGVSTSYNTGWMHGDIKGAFLSDTDATNVTGTELWPEGNFADANEWSSAAAQWTISGGTATVNYTGGGYSFLGNSTGTLTNGKKYILSFTVSNYSGGRLEASQANSGNIQIPFSANGSYTQLITYTGSTGWGLGMYGYGGGAVGFTLDNLYLRELEEEDRSVNNTGLAVYGTITKSAVATGAELVAYSGFSASNYLVQPNITPPGTGDFSLSFWIRPETFNVGVGNYFHLFSLGTTSSGGQASGTGFVLKMTTRSSENSNGYGPYFYSGDGTYHKGTFASGNHYKLGIWSHCVAMRKSGIPYFYINGVLVITGTSWTTNITDTYLTMGVGIGFGEYGGDAKVSLLRYSLSAPSPEQIKKIYEDEKVLFQENAACTLYGSSDAVTALAYDDKTNLLHVGTSSGRSDFKGLRRINNTTTGITTAISASNRLIAEQ